ncbi:MAG: hypothetical protein R2883_06190 [Caldisericia bacterium]
MEYKSSYDKDNNILTVTYTGDISSKSDIDYIVSKNTSTLKEIPKKVWFIVNLSELKISNPDLIKYYAQENSENMLNYTFAAVTYTTKAMQRVLTHMYNIASGRKRVPFFKTESEAVEHILELQKKEAI